jgi:hypothetical protein
MVRNSDKNIYISWDTVANVTFHIVCKPRL